MSGVVEKKYFVSQVRFLPGKPVAQRVEQQSFFSLYYLFILLVKKISEARVMSTSNAASFRRAYSPDYTCDFEILNKL